MLSLVEESQALQARFEKSKADCGTIYSALQSGAHLSLVSLVANVGKWAATAKAEGNGLYIDWALDGEGLYRGDRLLEVNGVVISSKSREELQTILGKSGKCQLVVLRRKVNPVQHQQLIQSQEDNLRLQHRISYLEEQVKELLENKDSAPQVTTPEKNPHVTSINITSPPVTPPDKPEVYQRGNFIMTIVGGKPVKKPNPIPISSSSASSASSASSVSSQHRMNGELTGDGGLTSQRAIDQEKPDARQMQDSRTHYERNLSYSQKQQPSQQLGTPLSTSAGQQQQQHQHHQNNMHSVSRSISASAISINSDMNRREKERRERERELRREIRDRFIYKSRSGNRLDGTPSGTKGLAYSKSGDQLHLTR